MKDLAFDICRYMADREPYDFCCNYENEAEATADILAQLQTQPEKILDYLFDDLEFLGDSLKCSKESDAWYQELNDDYWLVFNLINRIRETAAYHIA